MIPRQLHEYSNEEKIQAFDKLHNLALECWFAPDEDSKQWCFETVLELLAKNKKEFWEEFNKRYH